MARSIDGDEGSQAEQRPLSDIELARRAASGDQAAFQCIMRRHNLLLFRTARGILRNDADAEDTLQEAYLNAWRALAGFQGDARLSTWLVRIVINESLGRLRRRSSQPVPLPDVAPEGAQSQEEDALTMDDPSRQPEQIAMQAETRRLIEACIDRLPDAYREVFLLHAVQELSAHEISVALGISEANVRTRFLRARRLLRQDLVRTVNLVITDAFSFAGERCDRVVAAVLAKLTDEPPSSAS